MAKGRSGLGITVTWNGEELGTTLSGGCVQRITGPGIAVNPIEVTCINARDGFREFIPGLAEGGDLVLELSLDPDINPVETFIDPGEQALEIGFPPADGQASGATWTGQAIATGYEVTALDPDDVMSVTLTFRYTGPITPVAGS